MCKKNKEFFFCVSIQYYMRNDNEISNKLSLIPPYFTPPPPFQQIIKYYVLSPVEKNYINKIEEELKKSEDLDKEIKEVQTRIQEEKEKKLQRYKEEKEGKVKVNNKETCEALLREVIFCFITAKKNNSLSEIPIYKNNCWFIILLTFYLIH